ncbi:hypothetical protein Acr_11g0010990 [Actinidia rufa]|uniref:Uncharacterized protein n=1 Tax=Actinidia rufa TaxID=165716 RepID=A0A7J0FDX8_9ERIC|nr:hypothetical protein Acr_11g0010990 [Actinidia rufa]
MRKVSHHSREQEGRDLRLATAGKQARRTPAPELGAELPTTGTVRAKAIVVKKILLFSKLGVNNCSGARLRRRCRIHDDELPITPQRQGWVSHLPTDITVGTSKSHRAKAIKENYCSHSGELPHVLRTPEDRGGKLLADVQRVAKATSKQRPEGAEPSKTRSRGLKDPAREARKDKQHESYIDLESQGDSKSVTSNKRRVSSRRAQSSVDFVISSTQIEIEKVIYVKNLIAEQMWRKTKPSFQPGNRGNEHSKKVCATKVHLVQWKIRPLVPREPRKADDGPMESHGCLVYRVFPSSLGDLKLKWFDKLLAGLIESFHQFIESFVARKRYWETYNEIEECSEELAVVSYKLGLTLRERLWENLTLDPPINLRDLMSRVEMFARLEDDVKQEFFDEEKTQVDKDKFKLNSRFDRGEDKADKVMDEDKDLPLETIHMIGGPNHPNLENRIWGDQNYKTNAQGTLGPIVSKEADVSSI